MSDQPILHHFEASPFSEKIRIIFGFKRIAWRSVLIPRIMPKPDLLPLTGGYRRTPVMQIGADVFCDTQMITRALEARYPEPSLFPGGNAGLPWAVASGPTSCSFRTRSISCSVRLATRFRRISSTIVRGCVARRST